MTFWPGLVPALTKQLGIALHTQSAVTAPVRSEQRLTWHCLAVIPEDSICCHLFESCLHSGMRGRDVVHEAALAAFSVMWLLWV